MVDELVHLLEIVAFWWRGDLAFGLLFEGEILVNMLVAGVCRAGLPFMLQRLNIDLAI